MDSLNSYDAHAYDQSTQVATISFSYLELDLHNAASEGNFDAFRSHVNRLHLLLTPNRNTILHIYIFAQTTLKRSLDPMKLMRHPRQGRYQFLEQILNVCPSLLTQANTKGETPLHIAARYGQYDIVLYLLAHEYAKSQHEDLESRAALGEMLSRMRTRPEKDTALHEAVRSNHLQVVKVLIKEDPDLLNLANDAGETPLYLAAERGYCDMVCEMLKICNSIAAFNGPNGRTALHAAVICNDPEITIKILGKNGTMLTRKTDQQGWTPLHLASYLFRVSIVKFLLQFDISAAYIRDIDGRTPLLTTAACKSTSHIETRIEIMNSIISTCPDCCEIVDHKGKNVLHLAVESICVTGVHVLLHNALLANLINQKDDEGNTPLHQLAYVGFTSEDLLKHHLVDKFAVNTRNLTAIEIFSRSNWEDIMKGELRRSMLKDGHRPSWRNTIQEEHHSMIREIVDGIISESKKAKDAHLIVATLIATVTFAAGFTLPGGYNNDKGVEQGYAILSRKAAFNTFLITDTVALALSISVMFIHLFLPMMGNKIKFYRFFALAIVLIPVAMASMAVAFTAGIYAVLPHSSALGIVVCVIAGCFFLFCCFILYWSVTLFQIKEDDIVIIR